MTGEPYSPQRAANRLVRVTELYAEAHGVPRFPVDVRALALETARIFGWADPISEVREADIAGFEGALIPGDEKKEWLLLYSDAVTSPGRIRFTLAHELGHYILHRRGKGDLRCNHEDMLDWSEDERSIEAQADLFASYLLMPLDDFRRQVTATVDLDVLGTCAGRYGVSLTAAILKWLQCTDELVVLVMSNDGFINWASSSKRALKAGAFFRTRGKVIPLPAQSLAADTAVKHDRTGVEIPATVWFPHAAPHLRVREMKVDAGQYDAVLTLLRLPRGADLWPPREDSAQG